jgi:hypothetical protein
MLLLIYFCSIKFPFCDCHISNQLVLVDSESALHTDFVRELLGSYGVEMEVFPPSLGKIMNPCDEFFHSPFKRFYYKLVHENLETARERKYEFIRQAYYSIQEETIVKYFHHCGLLGNEEPSEVIERLVHSSKLNFVHPDFQELHCRQVEAFESWCYENKYDPND